jgi:hypothetical protein
VAQIEIRNFERQALVALTWLVRYTPAFDCDKHPYLWTISTTVSNISSLVKSAAPDIEDEGFQALDTIHDALQSSIFDAEEPVGYLFMPETSEAQILLAFWKATALLDNYWTARLEQIKQSEFARLICSGLLECRLEMISESCVLLIQFLLEEYSCESQGACKTFWSLNDCAYSWASSDRSNDEEATHMLIEACLACLAWTREGALSEYDTQTGSSEDYQDTLLATFDAKQLFVGGEIRFGKEKVGSLQLALPLQHVVRGHKTVFPSSFKRMRANLQLICFGPPLTGGDYTNHYTNYRFLDLSVRLSGYMLEFCTATPDIYGLYTSGLKEIVFAGTLHQRQECLKLIIQEVWQNTDNQLDAWGQLYLLACVKKSFSTHWKIAASDNGSEADKITDETELVP